MITKKLNCSEKIEKMFSRNIRALRLKNGFSQSELAAKASVATSTVAGLESNFRLPSMMVAIKISSALGICVDDLYKKEAFNGQNAA